MAEDDYEDIRGDKFDLHACYRVLEERNPGPVGRGVVIRNDNALVLGSLAQALGIDNSTSAEFWGAIHAFRIAQLKGMRKIWFECDSMHVIMVLSNSSLIPLRLLVHLENCLRHLSSIQFRFSYIYREGNSVADLLAKWGATSGS
ncbi:uncharacterized protein LOC113278869 [Papaver somniferum]|uniref:uncharacterized protein LOC113278869 n=1 Tax=Papaver somniferum TaxID=3469 RepID=UPI000E6F7C59|nr:uncharacterized protein LOC113278869 [Papaver somniferum]